MSEQTPTASTLTGVAEPGRGPVRPPGMPAQIGRYSVLGLLGRGGMGVVYLARDPVLGRDVAIKRIDGEGGHVSRDRLLREAQALARLAHPNVVAIHEVGEQGDDIFLAMELVAGETLRTWRRAEDRSIAACIAVAVQAGLGLAAAHDAGIVHRDIKPDNIMVGRDGRVRVMDFGLARAGFDAPIEEANTGRPAAADTTATGALRGTPGFMAPELWQGLKADVRSDVYSFSVVLFELLARTEVRPGHAAEDLRATLRAQAVARRVPAWLAAVILRGLADAPEDRWPSVAALLAALQADPVARRRRRLRLAGLVIAGAAVATVLVLGALELRARALRAAAERRAEVQRAAIDEAEDPEAAFTAFVADPEHRGTRALTRAWLHRGDLARGEGRTDDALAAYARAYVEAADEADVVATFRSLALVFAATWNGPALARAVDNLRALGVDDDELVGQEVTAALALRDPAGAVAAIDHRPALFDPGWRPLLVPLLQARPMEVSVQGLTPLPPGGPAAYLGLLTKGGEVLLGPDLEIVRRLGRDLEAVPGTSLALRERIDLVALTRPDEVLWRADAKIHKYVHVPFLPPPGLVLSYRWPALGFLRLDDLTGPARVAHPGTDRAASTFDFAWTGDLDGDGRDELLAAFGPHHAYDVRVFQADARGELQMVARLGTGVVRVMTVMRRGDERLLAIARDDSNDAPTLRRAGQAVAPSSLRLLRWTGAALEPVRDIPFPADLADAQLDASNTLAATDLDGDGDDELLLKIFGRFGWGTLLVRPWAQHDPTRLLGGVHAIAAVQLDDDPAHELVIRLLPGGAGWILGVGDAALPVLPRPMPASDALAVRDPWLAERVAHAEELAAMGRAGESAAALSHLARLTADEPAQARLLARAAALWTVVGDDERALAVDRRLASDPQLGAAALARTAEVLLRLGRHHEAHAAAVRLAAHPARSAAEAARAGELLERLAPLVDATFDLDLTGDGWRVHQPLGVRHDRTRGALALTAVAEAAPLIEVPLAWTGGAIAVRADLDVRRLESGACIGVRVVDERDAVVVAAFACGGAGDDVLWRRIGCHWADIVPLMDETRVVASGATSERFELRAVRFPDGTGGCNIGSEVGTRTVEMPVRPFTPGRLRVLVGAWPPAGRPALAEAELRGLAVSGARPAPVDPNAWDLAARHLAGDDPITAAAVLGDMPARTARERLIRVATADQLVDLAGLSRAIDEFAADALDPDQLPAVAMLVRTRPLAGAALIARVGPALLPVLDRVWEGLGAHQSDPEVRRLGLRELQAVHTLAPRTPAQHEALGRLLGLRGRLAARERHTEAAIRDLEAALSLGGDDAPDIHEALARLYAADSPLRAQVHAHAAVTLSPAPELARERLLREPALAGLLDRANLAP